ncbi:MAG: hypothetical protein ACKVOB_06310 [Sphingomonas sp.]
MTISPADATDALAAVDDARKRGAILRGYSHSGTIAIAWGMVWLSGNLTMQLAPGAAAWVWRVGLVLAIGYSVLRRSEKNGWRAPLTALAMAAFLLLAEAMLGGVDARLHNALTSALVGLAYLMLGIWVGVRFAVLGAAIWGAVVLGWFLFPAALYVLMGLGGGGAFIITGLWLRRA